VFVTIFHCGTVGEDRRAAHGRNKAAGNALLMAGIAARTNEEKIGLAKYSLGA